jgi:hypothetical protein
MTRMDEYNTKGAGNSLVLLIAVKPVLECLVLI